MWPHSWPGHQFFLSNTQCLNLWPYCWQWWHFASLQCLRRMVSWLRSAQNPHRWPWLASPSRRYLRSMGAFVCSVCLHRLDKRWCGMSFLPPEEDPSVCGVWCGHACPVLHASCCREFPMQYGGVAFSFPDATDDSLKPFLATVLFQMLIDVDYNKKQLLNNFAISTNEFSSCWIWTQSWVSAIIFVRPFSWLPLSEAMCYPSGDRCCLWRHVWLMICTYIHV